MIAQSQMLVGIQKRSSVEIWLVAFAFIAWGLMALRVHQVNLLATHYDEYTHIISARLITESLTPGMSQLGFWAPLLHVILFPFYAIPILESSGFAASIALLPFLCISVLCMHRILRMCVDQAWIAVCGAVLLCLNPYVLFFAVTPMAELLLLTFLLATVYYFLRWHEERRLALLVNMGVCVSLACLSRFEGFFLLPVATVAVAIALWRQKRGAAVWRAYMLLFLLPAVSGIAFIVLYSVVYSDSFLAYSTYSLRSSPASEQFTLADTPTLSLWLYTLLKMFYAGKYILSIPLVLAGLVSISLVALFSRDRLRDLGILFMLGAPLLFVYLTIYTGSLGMYVPEVNGGFSNTRYVLPFVSVGIVALCVLCGMLSSLLHQKVMKMVVSGSILSAMSLVMAGHLLWVSFDVPSFLPIFSERVQPAVREAIAEIREEYDFGRVLTLRYANDYLLEEMNLSLSRFIIESNYRYFDQAVKEPWLFARWVIFPSSGRKRFPQLDLLEDSPVFQRYYTPVAITSTGASMAVYRLNEPIVREEVSRLGIDPSLLPSLNQDAEWKPLEFYPSLKGVR